MQSQRGAEPILFRVPLQSHLQVNGVGREMFQVSFQFGDFLLQFFLQLSVGSHPFSYEAPFQNHRFCLSKSRFSPKLAAAYFRLELSISM